MYKGHNKDRHNYKRRPGPEEYAGYHRYNGPGRRAGHCPGKSNGKDPLPPVIDHPRACRTSYGTAETHQKRHDCLALKPQLCHGLVKYIGDPGHIADLFNKPKHQRDSKDKSDLGNGKIQGVHPHITHPPDEDPGRSHCLQHMGQGRSQY